MTAVILGIVGAVIAITAVGGGGGNSHGPFRAFDSCINSFPQLSTSGDASYIQSAGGNILASVETYKSHAQAVHLTNDLLPNKAHFLRDRYLLTVNQSTGDLDAQAIESCAGKLP